MAGIPTTSVMFEQEGRRSVRSAFVLRSLVILLAGTVGWSCATVPSEPPPTVPSVDLARSVGEWYEIARLPMWFQRHCRDSKARYSLLPDGRIGVHNECVTESGEVHSAEGVATVVAADSKARLSVTFDNWFARLDSPSRDGNYWILSLDSDYRVALVGTPDRRFLWILAREPDLDEAVYDRLVDYARGLGYPVQELIRDKRAT